MIDSGFLISSASRERAAALRWPGRERLEWRAYWLPTAIVLFASAHAAAEPPADAADEAAAAARATTSAYKRMRCLLSEPGSRRPRELKGHAQSLLRWSNPEIGRVYGDVFVWTDGGRPAAIVSLYRFYVPWQSLSAEFLALTPGLIAERDGQALWAPQSGGVEWHPLPDAPGPAQSPAARLRQMRLLAGRFSAALSDRRSNDSGDEKQMRLLTQPVFRYPAADGNEQGDGALFAFVVGTDPEVFLLLETRGELPAQSWNYALVRMNRDPIEVRLDGKPVWSAPYLDPEELKDNQRPYCCVELPLPNDES